MWKYLNKKRFSWVDLVIIQIGIGLGDFALSHLVWR